MSTGRLRARVLAVTAALVTGLGATACAPAPNPGPGATSFQRVVVDAATPASMVEKAFADLDNDGRRDAVAGFRRVGGQTGGIYWYAFPASGRATDPWVRRTVVAPAEAYEDMVAHDVDRDGWTDLIAAVDGRLTWFRNPTRTGTTWAATTIGPIVGRGDMVVGDLDGDGRADIATNSDLFFQDAPNRWVRRALGDSATGIALFDSGSGRGAIDIVRTSPRAPYDIVWMRNPRSTGGNARTGTWTTHRIGPGYTCVRSCNLTQVATIATGELTGDGRMDVVIGHGEGGIPSGATGVRMFAAPADRTAAWAERPVDPNFHWTHNLRIADVDANGTRDIVAAEEDQSTQRRVGWFSNDGTGRFTLRVIESGVGGHNVEVADAEGDGDLDVLSGAHGYFGADNPLVLYVNQRLR